MTFPPLDEAMKGTAMRYMHVYSPAETAKRATTDAGALGAIGVLLGLAMPAVRQSVALPWGPEQDVVAVGAVVGLLAGVKRGVRNWWKNSR